MVRDAIWKALNDAFHDLTNLGEQKIREKLQSLAAGDTLSPASPLIRVIAVNEAADTVRLLIRGAFPFDGITPFMRLEVTMSRSEIDLSLGEPPIRIKTWDTVLGDLRVEKKNAFDGELGFGYDQGAWLGQGGLKLLPIEAGAAICAGND
jgi:hypothetical protein